MSAGASPSVCLSFAGWLSHRLLSRASALRHLSSRSCRTRPSLTPPLCSRQLVVALHLFAPPPPLDAPPPHDWLCCRRCQCAGIFAIVAIAIVTLVASRRAASSPSLSSLSTSVAIVVVVVSRRAVTMVIVVVDVARCALAIIVDFAVRRAVAIVVVASLTSSSPVAPSQ